MHETRNWIIGNMENQTILKKQRSLCMDSNNVVAIVEDLSLEFIPMDGYYNYFLMTSFVDKMKATLYRQRISHTRQFKGSPNAIPCLWVANIDSRAWLICQPHVVII